jgi:uncharacterized C2H2 Zn-finger protein
MLYECPRCHYSSENRCHYVKHLNKKKPCPTTFSNQSIEELIGELKVYNKIYKCEYCDKSFSFQTGLSRHITEVHPNIITSVGKNTIKFVGEDTNKLIEQVKLTEQEVIEIDPSKQPLLDFAIDYKAKKNKHIEESVTKWNEEIVKELFKTYMKECMDKFYQENNRRREYVKVHTLVNHTCLTPNCTTQATNQKYRGYCCYCFVHQFPDEPITRNWKVKEKHVNDFIVEQYPDRDFTYNRSIKGGCSRKIPDWFFECLTHSIIVENDENQHTNYSCENKRNMELFQDLGNRPIVFIRFNPDSYIDEEDNEVPSSFKYHEKLGVPIIRDKEEWNSRLHKLKETLDFHLTNIPQKEVSIVNLFYDKNL